MDQTRTLILIILWAMAAFLIRYILWIQDSLSGLQKRIDRSWDEINTLLEENNEQAANLVNILKEYMGPEDILERVTRANGLYHRAVSLHEKAHAEKELSNSLQSLFSATEDYPIIAESDEFLQLRSNIERIENKITDKKKSHNEDVDTFNRKIQQFPGSLIATLNGYGKREMFEEKSNEN